MNLRIGVLVPQSKEYPLMAKEFINGFKLSMPDITCVIEGIGFGNDPKKVIDAIQKLVLQEDVTIITGILGHNGLIEVLQYVESLDVQLVYTTIQANKSIKLDTKNSFCNPFNLYEATYNLGKYLVQNKKKNIAVTTCYYEAGYGLSQALEEAIYENNEAEFSGHFITPLHPRENEASLLNNFIKNTQADAVVGFYSGTYAKEFADYLNVIDSKSTNIFISPFTINSEILKNNPKIFDGFQFVSSWTPGLDNEENLVFVKSYEKKWSKEPTIFSVLGYENALLINNKINKKPKEVINTPRGKLILNKIAQKTEQEKYLWTILWKEKNYTIEKTEILKEKEPPPNNKYIQNSNGWYNAYLCN